MCYPRVKECCCYFSLETGAKIIGFLHSGLALCLVIYTSYLATHQKRLMGTIYDEDGMYTTVYSYTVAIATTGSVHILLGATLLIGTFKRKKNLVLTWVVMMSLLFCGSIVFVFVLTTAYGPRATDTDIVVNFLQGTAFFAVTGFAIICVYSYHSELVKESHESERCATDEF